MMSLPLPRLMCHTPGQMREQSVEVRTGSKPSLHSASATMMTITPHQGKMAVDRARLAGFRPIIWVGAETNGHLFSGFLAYRPWTRRDNHALWDEAVRLRLSYLVYLPANQDWRIIHNRRQLARLKECVIVLCDGDYVASGDWTSADWSSFDAGKPMPNVNHARLVAFTKGKPMADTIISAKVAALDQSEEEAIAEAKVLRGMAIADKALHNRKGRVSKRRRGDAKVIDASEDVIPDSQTFVGSGKIAVKWGDMSDVDFDYPPLTWDSDTQARVERLDTPGGAKQRAKPKPLAQVIREEDIAKQRQKQNGTKDLNPNMAPLPVMKPASAAVTIQAGNIVRTPNAPRDPLPPITSITTTKTFQTQPLPSSVSPSAPVVVKADPAPVRDKEEIVAAAKSAPAKAPPPASFKSSGLEWDDSDLDSDDEQAAECREAHEKEDKPKFIPGPYTEGLMWCSFYPVDICKDENGELRCPQYSWQGRKIDGKRPINEPDTPLQWAQRMWRAFAPPEHAPLKHTCGVDALYGANWAPHCTCITNDIPVYDVFHNDYDDLALARAVKRVGEIIVVGWNLSNTITIGMDGLLYSKGLDGVANVTSPEVSGRRTAMSFLLSHRLCSLPVYPTVLKQMGLLIVVKLTLTALNHHNDALATFHIARQSPLQAAPSQVFLRDTNGPIAVFNPVESAEFIGTNLFSEIEQSNTDYFINVWDVSTAVQQCMITKVDQTNNHVGTVETYSHLLHNRWNYMPVANRPTQAAIYQLLLVLVAHESGAAIAQRNRFEKDLEEKTTAAAKGSYATSRFAGYHNGGGFFSNLVSKIVGDQRPNYNNGWYESSDCPIVPNLSTIHTLTRGLERSLTRIAGYRHNPWMCFRYSCDPALSRWTYGERKAAAYIGSDNQGVVPRTFNQMYKPAPPPVHPFAGRPLTTLYDFSKSADGYNEAMLRGAIPNKVEPDSKASVADEAPKSSDVKKAQVAPVQPAPVVAPKVVLEEKPKPIAEPAVVKSPDFISFDVEKVSDEKVPLTKRQQPVDELSESVYFAKALSNQIEIEDSLNLSPSSMKTSEAEFAFSNWKPELGKTYKAIMDKREASRYTNTATNICHADLDRGQFFPATARGFAHYDPDGFDNGCGLRALSWALKQKHLTCVIDHEEISHDDAMKLFVAIISKAQAEFDGITVKQFAGMVQFLHPKPNCFQTYVGEPCDIRPNSFVLSVEKGKSFGHWNYLPPVDNKRKSIPGRGSVVAYTFTSKGVTITDQVTVAQAIIGPLRPRPKHGYTQLLPIALFLHSLVPTDSVVNEMWSLGIRMCNTADEYLPGHCGNPISPMLVKLSDCWELFSADEHMMHFKRYFLIDFIQAWKEWIRHQPWAKREMYEEILNIVAAGQRPGTHASFFIKREITAFFTASVWGGLEEKEAKPRIVCCPIRTQLLGLYSMAANNSDAKAFEQPFTWWNVTIRVIPTSGKTPLEIGHLVTTVLPTEACPYVLFVCGDDSLLNTLYWGWYESDGKRFESANVPTINNAEFRFATKVMGRYFAQSLTYSRYWTKYVIPTLNHGCFKRFHVGQAVQQVFAHLWSALPSGVPHTLHLNSRRTICYCIVALDQQIIRHGKNPRLDIAEFVSDYEQMGILLEMHKRDDIKDISFCSAGFIPVLSPSEEYKGIPANTETYALYPRLDRPFNRLVATHQDADKRAGSYAHMMAQSFANNWSQIPGFKAIYEYLLRQPVGKQARGDTSHWRPMDERVIRPTQATTFWIARMMNLPVCHIQNFEDTLLSCPDTVSPDGTAFPELVITVAPAMALMLHGYLGRPPNISDFPRQDQIIEGHDIVGCGAVQSVAAALTSVCPVSSHIQYDSAPALKENCSDWLGPFITIIGFGFVAFQSSRGVRKTHNLPMDVADVIPESPSEAKNLMTNICTQFMNPRQCLLENRPIIRLPTSLSDRTAVAAQSYAVNTTAADTYVGGLQQTDSLTGCAFAMLFPHPRQCIWVTAGRPITATAGIQINYTTTMVGKNDQANTQVAALSQPMTTNIFGSSPTGVIPVFGASGPAENVPFYPLVTNMVGTNVNFGVFNILAECPQDLILASATFYTRDAITHVWAALTNPLVPPTAGGVGTYLTINFTLANTIDAWAFAINFGGFFSSFEAQFYANFTPLGSGATAVIPNVPHNFDVTDWPNLQQWPVNAVAFLAGSMLCTFVGSDLENGGDVAIVRCPIGCNPTSLGFNPNADTGFPSLTTVPYAYFGAVKEGAYSWLLPGFNAFRLSAVNNRTFNCGLFAAMNLNTRSASLLVTYTLVLCGTSSTGLLALAGPPVVPGFQDVLEILRTAPSATSNPSHTKMLSKAISKTAGVLTSDKFLDTMSGLGTAASMLGVPGASWVSAGAKTAKKAKKAYKGRGHASKELVSQTFDWEHELTVDAFQQIYYEMYDTLDSNSAITMSGDLLVNGRQNDALSYESFEEIWGDELVFTPSGVEWRNAPPADPADEFVDVELEEITGGGKASRVERALFKGAVQEPAGATIVDLGGQLGLALPPVSEQTAARFSDFLRGWFGEEGTEQYRTRCREIALAYALDQAANQVVAAPLSTDRLEIPGGRKNRRKGGGAAAVPKEMVQASAGASADAILQPQGGAAMTVGNKHPRPNAPFSKKGKPPPKRPQARGGSACGMIRVTALPNGAIQLSPAGVPSGPRPGRGKQPAKRGAGGGRGRGARK